MKKINDIFSYQLIDKQDQNSQWLKIESTKLITHTSYSAPTTADIIAKINQLNPESAHTFADSAVPKIIASVDSINGVETITYFGRYKVIVEIASDFDADEVARSICDYLGQVLKNTYIAQDLPFVPISSKNIFSN